MKKLAWTAAGFSLLGLCVSARSQPPQPTAKTDADSAVVKQYCVTCHNDRAKTGGLSLAAFDVPAAASQAPVAERVIRKLRAGMMPPPGARRPDEATLRALAEALEATVDRAAALNPNAGWRPFQRLNRSEYARAVRDLVAVDVDPDVGQARTVRGNRSGDAERSGFEAVTVRDVARERVQQVEKVGE